MASAARGGDTSPDEVPEALCHSDVHGNRSWLGPDWAIDDVRSDLGKSAAFDWENTLLYSEGWTASSPILREKGGWAERFEPRFAERKQPFQQERHARHSLMPGAAQLDANHRQSMNCEPLVGWVYRYGDSNPGPVAENHVS
jgi:hypothetical protein